MKDFDFCYNKVFLCIYLNVEREESLYMETLKVSSKSNPNSVAGALANVFREKQV